MNVNPNVPESVQRVLLKALAKDRVDRYATTEELIKAFKEAWTEAGVPMQGTAIVMRSATAKNEKLNDANQPAAPATADKVPEVKKKRTLWIWAGLGALILLCCAIAFFAIRNNRKNHPLVPANTEPSAPALQTPVPAATLPPTPSNQPPPPTPSNASPELQAAIEAVAKDSRNPDAHLQLSLALWDAKELRRAFDEMMQAANLADPNTPDFFIHAAEEYKKREAWTLAASMYMRLPPLYKGGAMPEDLQNNLREAVYKASEQIANLDLKFFDRLDNFNQPLAHLARGRHALYNGKIEEAKRQLDQARKIKPDMPEAALLEAEIAMKEGDAKKAKDILTSLSTNNAIPEWIRATAGAYLQTLP